MRFKHAFHVMVDNFATTYKLLVYRLVISLIVTGLCCAVIIPTLNNILSTEQYEKLQSAFVEFWHNLTSLNTEALQDKLVELKEALLSFEEFISDKSTLFAVAIVCLLFVHFIHRFLAGVGNYAAGSLVNDRMCLHAKGALTGSIIRNLGKACLYSIIYAPLALLYDAIGFAVVFAILFKVPNKVLPILVKIFLSAVIILLLYAVKFMLTCNWLPALINGKKNNRAAMRYSFDLRGKQSGGVLSCAVIMMLIIMALNIIACIFTLGAGLLITIPATEIMLLSYQFVNYFDNNGQKYFVDDYTVIGPKKEAPVSREEFFRGED